MKKYIFTLIAVLLLTSTAYGVASNRVRYLITVLDQWADDPITSVTQIDVQNESGVAVAVYSTKSGTTEVGSTGVITSDVDDGMTEFWYAGTAIDLTVTTATASYEIESFACTDYRFMLPSFLPSTSSSNFDQTADLDFTYGSWVIDGDTLNRLDMIPDNDGAILAIGDGTYQADVYMYSGSTAAYWLFDEGGGEVYYQTINLQLDDDADLIFGDGSDFTIDSDTSKTLDILAAANSDDYIVNFGLNLSGVDIKAFGAATGEYAHWDASADSWTVVGDLVLFTLTGTTKPFFANITGTVAGIAAEIQTTDGGITLDANGAKNGDINIEVADDMTTTVGGMSAATITGSSTFTAGGITVTSSGALVGDLALVVGDDYASTITGMSTTAITGSSTFTAGGITITSSGASVGDIALVVGDDYTNTITGNYTLAVTGTTTLPNIRYKRDVSVVTASTTVINATMTGRIYVTTAGTVSATFNLPAAAAGLTFTFVDISATAGDDLDINAGSGDTINGGNAAGNYVSVTDTVPASVTLTAADATAWVVTSYAGTWSNRE